MGGCVGRWVGGVVAAFPPSSRLVAHHQLPCPALHYHPLKHTAAPKQQVIAGEVLQYLGDGGDEVARAEAVRALCDLAERFAPDHQWFVDTMNELFEVAGALLPLPLFLLLP